MKVLIRNTLRSGGGGSKIKVEKNAAGEPGIFVGPAIPVGPTPPAKGDEWIRVEFPPESPSRDLWDANQDVFLKYAEVAADEKGIVLKDLGELPENEQEPEGYLYTFLESEITGNLERYDPATGKGNLLAGGISEQRPHTAILIIAKPTYTPVVIEHGGMLQNITCTAGIPHLKIQLKRPGPSTAEELSR